jgi:hypothetical protein
MSGIKENKTIAVIAEDNKPENSKVDQVFSLFKGFVTNSDLNSRAESKMSTD